MPKGVISVISLGYVITLLVLPAVAELTFSGGNMTVTSNINPLQMIDTRFLVATQKVLDGGDTLSITTDSLTSGLGGNQMFTRTMDAVVSQIIAQRQAMGGAIAGFVASGLQHSRLSLTVASSDTMAFRSNPRNIRFFANSGIDPNFSVPRQPGWSEMESVLTSGLAPFMGIWSNFIAHLTSPGGDGLNALSFVASDPIVGSATFRGSVNGIVNRTSEFGNITNNSLYTGEMANLSEIAMAGTMTVGMQ